MSFRFEFGTAGIRAPLGERDDQLNLRTVRVIANAVLGYMRSFSAEATKKGVCLAFDGRVNSRAFADEVCRVALGHGFLVRAFESEAPTPLLAYATRLYGAALGIMITASHNPPSDNGIKVYLEGGVQLGAPHDAKIAQLIAQASGADLVKTLDPAREKRAGRLLVLGKKESDAYLDAIGRLSRAPSGMPCPKLAYTALFGVGSRITRSLFARLGAHDFVEVSEQAIPRSDLGGLASPNPEEPSTLARLYELARLEDASVGFAHDPDADRLAVIAEDASGELRTLTGDEVGALIGSFLIEQRGGGAGSLLVSTLVSGGLLERIAAAHGATYLRTPTGFKWIASLGREHARARGLELLFGYEEALGYAFFEMADDKDGIAALSVISALCRELYARGQTLTGRLHELAREHGLFASRQVVIHTDRHDSTRIPALLETLRTADASHVLGEPAQRIDHAHGPYRTPLLELRGASGARVRARASGTEPKLKLYLETCEAVARDEAVEDAQQRAHARLDAIAAHLQALLK